MKPLFARLLFPWLAAIAVAAGAAELPQKVVSIEGVTEYRLANGLRVLTVPDPSADTVTVHITYLVGSRHEGYGEKGMAHLLEHLLFKGSPRVPNFKEEAARRGARWNGTTSYDRTTFFQTLSAGGDNLDWALGLEADRMVNAYIRKSDLEAEMTVVRNEFEMGENRPGSVLFERMQRLAFAWHNYGNPIIGSRSDIENVPIERLQAFYRAWYQPDNAVLIVGGRFDERRALELVAKYFGAIARPARSLPTFYTAEPTQDGERSVTLRRAGDTQLVTAMYRVPAASHPDYPAVDVLASLLGTAPTGRLHQALVQSGMASSAWGSDSARHDPGLAYFGAVLSKESAIDAARDALLGVVEGIARNPIRADEVERARTALLNAYEKTQIDSRSLISMLSESSALGDWRLLFLYRDRLRDLALADVQRVAERYLRPANRVLGMFVPTTQPGRAEIPATPDLAAALAGYEGREGVDQGEAFDPSPQNIEARVIRRELANGIRVALLPKKTRGANVVAQLVIGWGDESSKMNRGTACTLAGAMLTRGTLKRSRAELRDAFDKLKASVSVSGDGAGIEVRREQLDGTLRLVAEVLKEPAFPRQEFEELKRASLTGAESQKSDPSAIAGQQLSRHLSPYPKGHWFHTLTTEERIEELKGATLEDAQRCYHDFFGATRAEFAAVGDFDPEALARLVEELFGGWKSARPFERIPSRYFDAPPLQREIPTPDKANAVLRAGVNLRMRDDHPDFPAMVLGNYLLGGSSTARIPGRVREKEGLSYSTSSLFSAHALDETASFGVSAIFAPQNKQRVESAVREELERALKDGFGEEEVANARNGLLEARRLARAQDRALAGRLASYLYLKRSFAWDIELERRIAALSGAEVRDALRRHLDPAKLSVVKAGDFR